MSPDNFSLAPYNHEPVLKSIENPVHLVCYRVNIHPCRIVSHDHCYYCHHHHFLYIFVALLFLRLRKNKKKVP